MREGLHPSGRSCAWRHLDAAAPPVCRPLVLFLAVLHVEYQFPSFSR